jgi:hypothetical protein
MGSSVSPTVASISFETFKELAPSATPLAPRIWKRYVDDTFCVLKKTDVSKFLDHLNGLRSSNHFTMEMGSGNSLFVDTILTTRSDGLDVGVYKI